MLNLPPDKVAALMELARTYANMQVCEFTPNELRALQSYFTNPDRRVFFMYGLPSNILATLSAMYSRMKNPRGLRGVFVDAFLPAVLIVRIPAIAEEIARPKAEGGYDGSIAAYLKANGIVSLDGFIGYSAETAAAFEEMMGKVRLDPDYLAFLSDTAMTKRFLSTWLDAYGHNSIARMGAVTLCFEGVSLMAAKTLEWSRPGAGYVELSTRYVDLQGADVYPIAEQLAVLGADANAIRAEIGWLFGRYRELLGDNVDGVFPTYLRRYSDVVTAAGGNAIVGVSGEAFDVLGNLLPGCTLTSLAVTVTGEALPGILKHLLLDPSPENTALVEAVMTEAGKVGSDQFARHYKPTPVDVRAWSYLNPTGFVDLVRRPGLPAVCMSPGTAELEAAALYEHLRLRSDATEFRNLEGFAEYLFGAERGRHDKLPSEFEAVTVAFRGLMSFRSWRDLQRMGFSTHNRTLVSPLLGFYEYDKPAPPEVNLTFGEAHRRARRLYLGLQDSVPAELLQFIMPMGCRVGFTYSADLRQHEFCIFQRSKGSVNHEVRQAFLAVENLLRERYPWWAQVSTRAIMTPAFLFARGAKEGEEIPLDTALRAVGDIS